MARGVLGHLSSNPNQINDAYTPGGAFTTVGHVIAAQKHPPISLVIATINERILEVLQFMKRRGFTTPSKFLHAMSLRVILKKLTDELNQFGRHREVRHPASDFAEVDWESLDFERIGEAYRKAVPATSNVSDDIGLLSIRLAGAEAHDYSVAATRLIVFIQYNREHFGDGSAGVVVFEKPQQGSAWPKKLAHNQQSLFRSEPLLNLLDVCSGEQSKPVNLPPQQWWIGMEEIVHFTCHDVLAPLFESVWVYMPRISELIVYDTLWRLLSDYMTSTNGCRGVKLARFDSPEVYKLAAVRVDASPMKAFDRDQVSTS
ncbi:hypothetical protein K440DRAFT_638635 [Wilcoxina mikolae CBS 423.85]|nr:hypothetical protein K440DRAFT_638635 [Wilcoxina mikolae CBS 423.85]